MITGRLDPTARYVARWRHLGQLTANPARILRLERQGIVTVERRRAPTPAYSPPLKTSARGITTPGSAAARTSSGALYSTALPYPPLASCR